MQLNKNLKGTLGINQLWSPRLIPKKKKNYLSWFSLSLSLWFLFNQNQRARLWPKVVRDLVDGGGIKQNRSMENKINNFRLSGRKGIEAVQVRWMRSLALGFWQMRWCSPQGKRWKYFGYKAAYFEWKFPEKKTISDW